VALQNLEVKNFRDIQHKSESKARAKLNSLGFRERNEETETKQKEVLAIV
jgi:DNA-binding cell septation regulator SpoVG